MELLPQVEYCDQGFYTVRQKQLSSRQVESPRIRSHSTQAK